MTKPENIISFFAFKKTILTPTDLYKILLYCKSHRDTEKWDLSVEGEWVTAYTTQEDTGKFYNFLVAQGLDKLIEIVRG